MRFRDAAGSIPAIQAHCMSGLQAIPPQDRKKLRCDRPDNLRGSVFLDKALRAAYPHAPRWDYAIGIATDCSTDRVVWLEVHGVSSGHVEAVLRKLEWLKGWLATEGAAMNALPRCFIWLAAGGVAFSHGSPQRREIAARGLQFRSGPLWLDRTG